MTDTRTSGNLACAPAHCHQSRALLALVAAVALCAATALPALADNTPGSDREIKELLTKWGVELEKWDGDYPNAHYGSLAAHAQGMASLYTMDATLLPTVSDGVYKQAGGKLIEGYFKDKFLKQQPRLFAVPEQDVELLGSRVKNGKRTWFAASQGLYTFRLFADVDGVPFGGGMFREVKARFTFVYEQQAGGPWRIRMHHSSAEPNLPEADRSDQIKALLTSWGERLKEWQPGYPGHPGNPDYDPNGMSPWRDIAAHAEGMADLYAQDGSLLPTVKDKLWRKVAAGADRPAIKEYFEIFLKSKPKLEDIGNSHVGFKGDIGYYQGLYKFRLYAKPNGDAWPAPEDPNQSALKEDNVKGWYAPVYARFTFVYRKGKKPDWSDAKIIQHHSSLEPTKNPHLPGLGIQTILGDEEDDLLYEPAGALLELLELFSFGSP